MWCFQTHSGREGSTAPYRGGSSVLLPAEQQADGSRVSGSTFGWMISNGGCISSSDKQVCLLNNVDQFRSGTGLQ